MSAAPVRVEGARVGVLGLGRSGDAVSRLLAARGARVYASDIGTGERIERSARELAALGVAVDTGRHDPNDLERCDWFVVSPGIPPSAPVLSDSPVADRPGFSEIEVASWYARADVVAITGTNGKTTTTAMLGAVATSAGLDVSVAGNIGRPFSTAVEEDGEVDWYVLEVSSFQLSRIAVFQPRIAVVVNLAADHLDTYPDFEAYARDKARIAENQTLDDHLCLDAETGALAGFGADRPVQRHWFHRTERVPSGAWVDDGRITLTVDLAPHGSVLDVEALGVPGRHNVQNALGATVAAALMGIEPEAIAIGLGAFTGVPHRLESVAEIDGVLFVNDSKATNVDSAVVGLEAFDRPLIAILGGRHKGSSYEPLGRILAARGGRALAIGEAAERIVEELNAEVEAEVVGTLDRAVERAREVARPGDVVLLSPACSSYDQFTDFEARGERFRSLVEASRSGG